MLSLGYIDSVVLELAVICTIILIMLHEVNFLGANYLREDAVDLKASGFITVPR
jgi:hypothetical protein